MTPHERLIWLADKMEENADDPAFLKELRREYRIISKELFPKKTDNLYSAAEIKNSRKEALKEIEKFLEVEDVDKQFDNRSSDYYSNDKFIVSWKGNYNGMKVQYSLDKSEWSGKAIKAVRNFFLEKQLKAYPTIERGLLEIGLEFIGNRNSLARREFWDKYIEKYNKRIRGNAIK